MPRDNARQVLSDSDATLSDIEDAIARLEADITYIERSLVHNPQGDLTSSLRESRALLWELKLKLSNQNK